MVFGGLVGHWGTSRSIAGSHHTTQDMLSYAFRNDSMLSSLQQLLYHGNRSYWSLLKGSSRLFERKPVRQQRPPLSHS